MTAYERFHAHLDEHEQCRENPVGMCPIGNRLLQEAADEVGRETETIARGLGFPMGDDDAPQKTEPQR